MSQRKQRHRPRWRDTFPCENLLESLWRQIERCWISLGVDAQLLPADAARDENRVNSGGRSADNIVSEAVAHLFS